MITLRTILLLLHIFGAVMLIGPVLLALPLMLRYLQKRPLATTQLAPLLSSVGHLPKVGGIVQMLTGLALVVTTSSSLFAHTWVWASVLLLVAAAVLGETRINPALKQLAALAAGDQVTEAAVMPLLAQANRFVTINAVLAGLVLVLMIVRI